MSELFKGFEQLLELAKLLEEKAEKGELKASVQVNRAGFSSIPRNTGIGVNRAQPAPTPAPDVIVTPPPTNPASLQNVGGLSEVLRELRELVELPLKRPEVLAKLGLEPIRGVLLAGSPGTGKTLTARSLAEELGVNYIAIAAPEVMGKYYGEAEARLRNIFEKAAASTPCIIFIDEIDSLAPDRAKVEGEVEKRVVAQLLSLMDGFAQTNGVIVLAATNRPDHLDPALRRPGRFDREVQFRVPDREGRLEILQILTRSMPLNSVDLNDVADLTVGMVGADLKAVCQKAAYTALRRQVASLDAVPNELSIDHSDFLQALKEIKPSVLRSVEVESPNITWNQIGGLEKIKLTLQEAVEGAILYPELYEHTGAKAPRGILLWGLPGTGKTLLAKAVASQARANFIAVNGAELMSRWVGAAEQEVRDLFNKARQASPCVVFIDEIDTLAPVRGKFNGDSGVSDRVVGQLLTELDGLQDCGTVLLIGATNRPDELDPALLRAGRLDLQIQVDLPDQSSRLEILRVHNLDRPLSAVDLATIATQTEGWNGADLALLSNQAALQAIRRYRSEGMTEPANLQINEADFAIAHQALLSQRR
ncbi:MAG TPA: AAA family ATPase [Leptolyngbya sp.]|jgi:transitional endoplasmic reticulum ATPase|nr:AAA family ATPase [Leptolyngbya sp.]